MKRHAVGEREETKCGFSITLDTCTYCISLLKLTIPQTVGKDGDVRESTQLDQRKVLLSYPVLFLGKEACKEITLDERGVRWVFC
jgi:hypothetical protein